MKTMNTITTKHNQIQLSNEDFNILKLFKIQIANGYATTSIKLSNGKFKALPIHKLITNTIDSKFSSVIDHIDRNPLNNLRSNLRKISQQENTWNNSAKGITKCGKKYRVRVGTQHIGMFNTEEEARIAHKVAKSLIHKIEPQSIDYPECFSVIEYFKLRGIDICEKYVDRMITRYRNE